MLLQRAVSKEVWSATVILRKQGSGLASDKTAEPLNTTGSVSKAGEKIKSLGVYTDNVAAINIHIYVLF